MLSPSRKGFDYIILSPFVDLNNAPLVAEFIRKSAYEVSKVGPGGRNYILPSGFNRHSGYSAVIYKVKK
jgi:hypothetical protein